MAVTIRAPSSTARASHGRGSSLTFGKMSPSEVVQQFIAAVNAQDWREVRRAVDRDFVRHSRAGGDIRGADSLVEYLKGEFVAFPDAQESCALSFSSESFVAVLMTFSGTQSGPLGKYPPSMRRLESPYLAIYRVESDLIVEAWTEWDNLTSLSHLGHLSP